MRAHGELSPVRVDLPWAGVAGPGDREADRPAGGYGP
ncbi:hypothetical protein SAMN05444351_4411 [Geodermatophilus nigrescens]|uniref:Uncharacterized protein n=1 Tax=Geodermatophilus nigrescens TaxID=1070870 RepID=A0A1M5RLS6_9ACTN|nr:hypothetical protein SAMN05444351_4411 [Geodermatophilus nigrescens]